MNRALRWLGPIALAAEFFLLGTFAHALTATSDHPLSTSIQVALIAGTVALTVGIIGLSGVVVGAAASAKAGRDARLDEQNFGRFVAALAISQKHSHDIGQQVASRAEAAKHGLGPEAVSPTVGSTDPVEEAINVLYLFARQATADEAWAMYNAVLTLSAFAFDAKKHVVAGVVVDLIPEEVEAHKIGQAWFLVQKTRYIDAVRKELGLPPLKPAAGEPEGH